MTHAYVLPLAIALFAAFTIFCFVRVVQRATYIKRSAGHLGG